MSKQRLLRASRHMWLAVVLLGFVAISWRTLISSFAGNVGLLLLARSLASSDPLELDGSGSDVIGQEQAQQWLHVAVQLDPANTGAWRGQGFGLAAQGQEQGAIAAWHAAGLPGLEFIKRGETARLAGKYSQALTWYARAEQVEPSLLSSIRYFRFLAQRSLGNADAAFDNLHQAIITDQGWINPDIRFRAWHAWGVWLLEQRRNVEAEQALHTAISVFPNDPMLRTMLSETYRFLGLAQWAQNRLDEAANNLRTAVQFNEQNVWAHIHYGKVLYLQSAGHLNETENEFAVALRLSPNNADIWQNLIEFWHWVKVPGQADAICEQARARSVTLSLTEMCPAQ